MIYIHVHVVISNEDVCKYISIMFDPAHVICNYLFSTYSSIVQMFHSQSMMIKELVLVHSLFYILSHMLYLVNEHSC